MAKATAPHLSAETAADIPTIGLEEAALTPILREYKAIKDQYPQEIVLARLGDFYEMFGEDAERAAPILEISLTGRGFGKAGRLPMCGIPHHASTQYIRRLLDDGKTVVLWDQVGPVPTRGLVKREVTRVLTAGTVIDDVFLDEQKIARCVALYEKDGKTGLAAFDAGSGELWLEELSSRVADKEIIEECARLNAAEILIPEASSLPNTWSLKIPIISIPSSSFNSARGLERLTETANVASLKGFGAEDLSLAHGAAGAILAYCERSRVKIPVDFLRIRVRQPEKAMALDTTTVRNLELIQPAGVNGCSLFELLNCARTPMGTRLLKGRIMEPLVESKEINSRLKGVELLVTNRSVAKQLDALLDGIKDLERLVGRCIQGLANPRDLVDIARTCQTIPQIKSLIGQLPEVSSELNLIGNRCNAPTGLAEHLLQMLVDDPPANLRDGGAIRPSADPELESLHNASRTSREYLSDLEKIERERTGIKALKVGYNRVFGYYLEISNSFRGDVPSDYVRKQTLANAERYVTTDLKEHESRVLSAREQSIQRETELLRQLVDLVAESAAQLLASAEAIASIDVAFALAETAVKSDWVKPMVDDEFKLEIVDGRHPLVEKVLPPGTFVPNDCNLDVDNTQLVILTGPNMAGKSTWLRQTALIALLAHLGSYVPAKSAHVGVVDRIFTRVGAHDDLASGMSTFMVEMTETALILNSATKKSLLVLDEIGRGTSTYDGLSIAQAVIEYIHEAPQLGCRTLFATHYHELTELSKHLSRVHNARVEVREDGSEITFLHHIIAGGADRSYGIHVAKLAGIAPVVLRRAQQLLEERESQRPLGPTVSANQLDLALPEPTKAALPHPVIAEIAQLDLDQFTPLDALNKLAELHKQATP